MPVPTPGTISLVRERSASPRCILHFLRLCPIFASVGVSSGLRRHLLGYLRQVTTIRLRYLNLLAAVAHSSAGVPSVHETGTKRRSQPREYTDSILEPHLARNIAANHTRRQLSLKGAPVLEIKWICVSHHSQGLRLAGCVLVTKKSSAESSDFYGDKGTSSFFF